MATKTPASNQVAPKKAAVKTVAKKPVAKAGRVELKPIKEQMTKAALLSKLSEVSTVGTKDVKKVFDALEAITLASISKKGLGEFMLPGLLKVMAVKVPAKPKRKGKHPFTGEEHVFVAKPASIRVKVRPLKKLKDAAL